MSLGYYDSRKRSQRRKRLILNILKWLVVLSAISAAGIYAFDSGYRSAEANAGKFGARIAELEAQLNAGRESAEEGKAAMARLQQEIPNPEVGELLTLLRERLAEGLSPERLTRIIQSASIEDQCDAKSVSKRFVVHTPLSEEGNDFVTFANNLITVTARGSAARSRSGAPESWYDVKKPLTVTFTLPGGEESTAEGPLPLQHSVVIGNVEHRFSLVPGPVGFLRVTKQSCAYP